MLNILFFVLIGVSVTLGELLAHWLTQPKRSNPAPSVSVSPATTPDWFLTSFARKQGYVYVLDGFEWVKVEKEKK